MRKHHLLLLGALVTVWLGAFAPAAAIADETGTKDGPVWDVWYTRVDELHFGQYLTYLSKIYRHELEAWKKAGIIVGYKIITSSPSSPDDWNLAILLEYKNYATYDIPQEKWDEVEKKALANVPGVAESKAARVNIRRVIGKRTVREVIWDDAK